MQKNLGKRKEKTAMSEQRPEPGTLEYVAQGIRALATAHVNGNQEWFNAIADEMEREITALIAVGWAPAPTVAEKCAEIVRAEIREPRPHQALTRSVSECDITVNASLGKAAHAIRAAFPKPKEKGEYDAK